MNGDVQADVRLHWLERFGVVSKLVLRRHWRETLRTGDYARLGPEDAAELLATMEWVVDAFTLCLKEQRSFDAAELARFRELGVQRAQQGITFDGLRTSFQAGVEQCAAEFADIVLEASGPQVGQVLTRVIVRKLRPLAAAAEKAFTAGYNDGVRQHARRG